MGTTLTALNERAGVKYVWVIAIEGYSYLLTDGVPGEVVDAWAGTDWEFALGGLFVHGSWEQSLDPWDPKWEGGSLTFAVARQADGSGGDTFGVDTHKTGGGTETRLSGTGVDANDTTINAKSVDSFAASGEIHIGTECIGYSSRDTGTDQFTVSARGKYAPFAADSESGTRFGRCHYAPVFDYEVEIRPAITSIPRTWAGRWVGLWMHRVVGGVLDVKAQAQLMWAGKVAEIRDTPDGMTLVDCDHVLSSLGKQVIFRDQYAGKIAEGVWLRQGIHFSAEDFNGTAVETANDLEVVASGAAGANEIDEGYYSAEEIIAAVNQWLYSELAATRLSGKYDLAMVPGDTGTRTRLTLSIPGSNDRWVNLTFPGNAWEMLGFDSAVNAADGSDRFTLPVLTSRAYDTRLSPNPPLRIHPYQRWTAATNTQIFIEGFRGEFVDQRSLLPPELRAITEDYDTLDWGVIILDGQAGLAGKISDDILILRSHPSLANITGTALTGGYYPRRTIDEPGPMDVKQVILLQGSFLEICANLFLSTGTAAYNHATYDALGYGLGAGVPWELTGDSFITSLTELDGSRSPNSLLVYLDRPTKLNDLIGSDLLLRRAHLVWKNGGIRFTSWSTPTAARAVHTLTDSNKAAAAGTTDHQRTVAHRSTKWVRNLVKIEYNRDFGGNYRDVFEIHDQGAMDDAGEARPVTISARNTFGAYSSTGEAAEALGPAVTAWLPFFSREVILLSRTISPAYYASMAPGDIVTITDAHVRDPATGLRGITGKPGIIVAHRFDTGGPDPTGGPARGMIGEVEIVLLDVDRVTVYSPSAMVDWTAGGAGYNAGTKVLTCYAHYHSETSEAADATHFVATDAVTVVEIDPTTAASPQSWDDVVASQTGNTITLTTGLAGFDTAKRYRVMSRVYTSATATQKADCYQADDADGLISDVAQPYEYGADYGGIAHTEWAAGIDLPERYATIAYGDGKPLDTGYEFGLINNLNSINNYFTAPFHNHIDYAASAHTPPAAAGWHVMYMLPVFIGGLSVYDAVGFNRYLKVSAFARATTGSPKVRFTLSATPPSGTSYTGVTFPGMSYSVEWTLSGTSWGTLAESDLDTVVLTNTSGLRAGLGYLTVECEQNAEVKGINSRLGPLE